VQAVAAAAIRIPRNASLASGLVVLLIVITACVPFYSVLLKIYTFLLGHNSSLATESSPIGLPRHPARLQTYLRSQKFRSPADQLYRANILIGSLWLRRHLPLGACLESPDPTVEAPLLWYDHLCEARALQRWRQSVRSRSLEGTEVNRMIMK
jgi:hypothetical protein